MSTSAVPPENSSTGHASSDGNILMVAIASVAAGFDRSEPMPVPARKRLFTDRAEADNLYFPGRTTLISLVRTMSDGSVVEVGIVGGEGFVSPFLLLYGAGFQNDVITQIEGEVYIVSRDLLKASFDRDRTVRELVLNYDQYLLEQTTQTAVCNRLHTIRERLSNWLLKVHQRIGLSQLKLTHEFISQMLGVRRAGTTLAIEDLVQEGLVEQQRGAIFLRDLDGLNAAACECWESNHRAYNEYLERLAAIAGGLGQAR